MEPISRSSPSDSRGWSPLSYVLWGALLLGTAATSFVNFLLFHTLAELFSIIIACSIFIVAWNTRQFAGNNYLLFLGIVYLFVGMLDLTHTLAYKGMNILAGHDANLPTQLWIGARYMESISLAIAPLFFSRRLNVPLAFWLYAGLTASVLASLFIWPIFPDCFIEGSGLTPFKKMSEYIISGILLAATVMLYRNRAALDKTIFRLVTASLLLTIGSEIAFTFYVSVYGLSNLVGHIFKIISFSLIYQAVVVATLTTPCRTLFREITQSEREKKRVIAELQEALRQVKILQGFLPICAACKQVRDDSGYWREIEQYIAEHSELIFSHGLCPDCAERMYPDFYSEEDHKSGIRQILN